MATNDELKSELEAFLLEKFKGIKLTSDAMSAVAATVHLWHHEKVQRGEIPAEPLPPFHIVADPENPSRILIVEDK